MHSEICRAVNLTSFGCSFRSKLTLARQHLPNTQKDIVFQPISNNIAGTFATRALRKLSSFDCILAWYDLADSIYWSWVWTTVFVFLARERGVVGRILSPTHMLLTFLASWAIPRNSTAAILLGLDSRDTRHKTHQRTHTHTHIEKITSNRPIQFVDFVTDSKCTEAQIKVKSPIKMMSVGPKSSTRLQISFSFS